MKPNAITSHKVSPGREAAGRAASCITRVLRRARSVEWKRTAQPLATRVLCHSVSGQRLLKRRTRSAHTCFRELLCCLFPIVAIRGGLETDTEFGGMPSTTYLTWGPGIRVLSSQRNRSHLRRSRKSRFHNRRNLRYRLWDRRSRICRLLIQNLVDDPIRCLDLAGQAGPSSFSWDARENARAFSGHR
jgi:hypothetical protein